LTNQINDQCQSTWIFCSFVGGDSRIINDVIINEITLALNSQGIKKKNMVTVFSKYLLKANFQE